MHTVKSLIEFTQSTESQMIGVLKELNRPVSIKGKKRYFTNEEAFKIKQLLVDRYGLTIYEIHESKINK